MTWKACAHGSLECTRAKRDATDPSHKVGTLFVNPGDPGRPSSQLVQLFAHALGKQVRDRFDAGRNRVSAGQGAPAVAPLVMGPGTLRGLTIGVVAVLSLSGCTSAAPDHRASAPSASPSASPSETTSGTPPPALRSLCPKVKEALPTLSASSNRVLTHRAFGYRIVEITQDADPATQRSLADLISASLLYSRRDLPASDQAFLDALDDVDALCKRAGTGLL